MMFVDRLLGMNLIPDSLIRLAIRRAIGLRLTSEDPGTPEEREQKLAEHVYMLRESPLAVDTAAANQQHYEVPAAFFRLVLGPRMKYSCALWEPGIWNLRGAEEAMLNLTCERARLEDGQTILELGCGWGSLTLLMAERYPQSRIVAVSNSASQKRFIDGEARTRGLENIEVVTCDMQELTLDRKFDRVVSVEMFEHMRNYEELMRRIAGWLEPGGLLFVHIFSHSRVPYLFEDNGETDWIARHFFTGGQMPSDALLMRFQDDLRLADHWTLSGTNYQKTAEAWLERMDENELAILPIFEATYGEELASRFFTLWRIFFMSCAEVWGFRGGREWIISHYLFQKPRES